MERGAWTATETQEMDMNKERGTGIATETRTE